MDDRLLRRARTTPRTYERLGVLFYVEAEATVHPCDVVAVSPAWMHEAHRIAAERYGRHYRKDPRELVQGMRGSLELAEVGLVMHPGVRAIFIAIVGELARAHWATAAYGAAIMRPDFTPRPRGDDGTDFVWIGDIQHGPRVDEKTRQLSPDACVPPPRQMIKVVQPPKRTQVYTFSEFVPERWYEGCRMLGWSAAGDVHASPPQPSLHRLADGTRSPHLNWEVYDRDMRPMDTFLPAVFRHDARVRVSRGECNTSESGNVHSASDSIRCATSGNSRRERP